MQEAAAHSTQRGMKVYSSGDLFYEWFFYWNLVYILFFLIFLYPHMGPNLHVPP